MCVFRLTVIRVPADVKHTHLPHKSVEVEKQQQQQQNTHRQSSTDHNSSTAVWFKDESVFIPVQNKETMKTMGSPTSWWLIRGELIYTQPKRKHKCMADRFCTKTNATKLCKTHIDPTLETCAVTESFTELPPTAKSPGS